MTVNSSNQVLVVIITMGNMKDVEECIGSLKRSSTRSFDILVVQNTEVSCLEGSAGSVETIVSGGNIGFAKGNNLGIRRSVECGYYATLLLNDDMIVAPDMMGRLIDTLRSAPDIGIVGPATYFYGKTNELWAAGGDVFRWRARAAGRRTLSPKTANVDYIPGSGLAFRNSVLEATGLLPEKYFYAYEEAEFCLRARRNHLLSVVDPQAVAWHKVGITSRRTPETIYNDFRNRLIFAEFLHGKIIGRALGRLITTTRKKHESDLVFILGKRAWRDHQAFKAVELSHLLQIKKEFGETLTSTNER
jgi:GT2 family glycosyltransferase